MRRMVWAGLILIGAAAAIATSWRLLAGTPLERARSAYARGDLESALALSDRWLVSHPDDLEGTRMKGRSLAGLGRGGEAYPLFERLGGDRLNAEDLVVAGTSLLKSNREALALAAFNAASKLGKEDRGRAGQTAAIVAPAAGKADLRATKESERLAVAPSGAGLGELVLAIASADDPSRGSAGPPSFLTRVLRLDRPTLQAIDGAPAARKLMARLMLEDGQAQQAEARLRRVDADDPEANWLRSRALLVEGDLAGASAASARSHGFGSSDPTKLEPAPYVGTKRCAACHSEIFQAQQKTGHAETFATGEAMKTVPLPRGGSVQDPGDPGVLHHFEITDRGLELESGSKGEVVRAVLDYALGSGRHGVTMLAREESGRHRSLRLSYYTTGGEHWDLTSGLAKRPEDKAAFIGPLIDDNSFIKCLNCHTTRFTSERERTGPEAADRGIGCERCHGPADHHLRSVKVGFSDPAIGRPKSARPAQRLKVCAQCHGPDGVIPPSDPRFVRFQAANLPYSRCVTETAGGLDCVGCHDPHRPLETDTRYYEIRCLACHDGAKSPPSALPAEVRIEAVAAKACPINRKTGCIECHMPKIKEVMPFTDFTDHHIRVHRGPDGAKTAAVGR